MTSESIFKTYTFSENSSGSLATNTPSTNEYTFTLPEPLRNVKTIQLIAAEAANPLGAFEVIHPRLPEIHSVIDTSGNRFFALARFPESPSLGWSATYGTISSVQCNPIIRYVDRIVFRLRDKTGAIIGTGTPATFNFVIGFLCVNPVSKFIS